jgi:CobQ/CobB/MinD/ParA nucleotide binding domain
MAKTQTLLENLPNSYLDQESQIQETSTDSSTPDGQRIKTVHITLQGKGGIGKSFVSLMLAQYLKQHDPNVLCLDTDPVNVTFSSFSGLRVRTIALLEDNVINERHFDEMMEQILQADCDVVIDNGAASYVPLSSYLIDNEAFDVIQNAGKHVIVHSIIAGGLAQANTISDFAALASQLPDGVDMVVWLNEYHGEIEADGKVFQEMRGYLDNKHRVIAIVELPKRTGNTYGKDIDTMLKRHLTFEEAVQSEIFFLMSKQRIKIVQRSIYEQLEAAI